MEDKYTIPSFRLSLTPEEIGALCSPLRDGNLCLGTEVRALEYDFKAYLDKRHAVAVATGTSALHLSLLALNIKTGCEVLMPSYVCSAVLNAVRYVNATAVLCEIAPGGYLIDPEDALRKVTPATGAIIVPEIFGYRADLSPYKNLNLPIILDRAMSLGSRCDHASASGVETVSVFSFYATKVITSGHGGLVATDNDTLASRVRDLRAYDKKADGKIRFNYTLTDFQAALARKQLALLEGRIRRKMEIIETYSLGINNPRIKCPPVPQGWNGQCFILRVPDGADPFIEHLRQRGITAVRPVFRPLHAIMDLDSARFRETEQAWRDIAAIPCFPDLTGEEVSRIIDTVNLY
ncbi:DegT/DnrJ/EryC1/StrS family aminotransferase [Acidobacteriota bacterium]